jgi:hypothetical protein
MTTAKKSQPKQPANKQKIFNMSIAVAIVLLAFTAYVTLVSTSQQLEYRSISQFNRTQDMAYDFSKLQFCYERDIHPCDDIAIEEWNKSHTDDTFNFLTPSQLHGVFSAPIQ